MSANYRVLLRRCKLFLNYEDQFESLYKKVPVLHLNFQMGPYNFAKLNSH
jgi:hypothetical protein